MREVIELSVLYDEAWEEVGFVVRGSGRVRWTKWPVWLRAGGWEVYEAEKGVVTTHEDGLWITFGGGRVQWLWWRGEVEEGDDAL